MLRGQWFSNLDGRSVIHQDGMPNSRKLQQVYVFASIWASGVPQGAGSHRNGRMGGLESIGTEIYGESCSKSFPSLEVLRFRKMPEWRNWIHFEGVEQKERFPRLRQLYLFDCPQLLGNLPAQLPGLEELQIYDCKQLVVSVSSFPLLRKLQINTFKEIYGCKQLVVSVSSFPLLRKLEIHRCEEVVFKTNDEFNSLKSVILSHISKLTSSAEGGFMEALAKVEKLEIDSRWQQESVWLRNGVALLQSLSFLHDLKIARRFELDSLGTEEEGGAQQQIGLPCGIERFSLSDYERLEKLPNLNCLTSLTELRIYDCRKLTSIPCLPSSLKTLEIAMCDNLPSLLDTEEKFVTCRVERLSIRGCRSLACLSSVGKLPTSLKSLEIIRCRLVEYIVEAFEFDNNNSSTLETLQIGGCANLKCLSSTGNLPPRLRFLSIEHCCKIESLGHKFDNNSLIETIAIIGCKKFKFLPEGLHFLCHLRKISIEDCPSMVSFPQGGLPTANFTSLQILDYEKLEALPDGIHNLTSLQNLYIRACPGIASFPERGFPDRLRVLSISNSNFCKPLFEWGLHRLTLLTELSINDGCPDFVSFPPVEMGMMRLPSSLTHLAIVNFPNLKQLSPMGFENLTSLKKLFIRQCPKLTSLPGKRQLLSLLQLHILDCPLLKQRCKRNTGQEWSKIAHIPKIQIDGKLIYYLEEEQ